MPEEQWIDMEEKLFYRIRDVAEILGESASTLRYWESEFPELNPSRGQKGRRLYKTEDIDKLRIIQYLLRVKGMHIKVAQEQLHKNGRNISTRVIALNELQGARDDLSKLLEALKIREKHI